MSTKDSETTKRRQKDPECDRHSPRSKDKEHQRRDPECDQDSLKYKKKERRRKDHDCDQASLRSKNKERSHKKSQKGSNSVKDSGHEKSAMERRRKSHSSRILREADSRVSSSISLPYPPLSVAHSKEVLSKPGTSTKPRMPLFTPDPTDLSQDGSRKDASNKANMNTCAAPPSPPLTAAEPDLRRSSIGNNVRDAGLGTKEDVDSGNYCSETVSPSPQKPPKFMKSNPNISSEISAQAESSQPSTVRLQAESSTSTLNVPKHPCPARIGSLESLRNSGITPTSHTDATASVAPEHQGNCSEVTPVTDSDATSVAPDQKGNSRPPPLVSHSDSPSFSIAGSSPHTPTIQEHISNSVKLNQKEAPVVEVFAENFRLPSVDSHRSNVTPQGIPPPPPPPPVFMPNAPRVDYLLQNGGLPGLIPRNFISAILPQSPINSYQHHQSPRAQQQSHDVLNVFSPYQTLLELYSQVITKNGSIAVATGYRSVARRLLDRLGQIFNRDISSEICDCIICRESPTYGQETRDEATGINWGGILELVSGRKDLPPWPPFFMNFDHGLGTSGMETRAPMQTLDIDVPEEYREHYVRQSKKTQRAVQSWLASQPETRSSPPQEVDDDTLTFAILTHLEPEKRRVFAALQRGMTTLPSSRAPTPKDQPKPELLARTAHALQRLYRLSNLPRDTECALYLLKNPELHGALATLAAISPGEWDILTSGRFDGFLWSGAEAQCAPSGMPFSRMPSRASMVAPNSRTTTPFSPPSAGPSRASMHSKSFASTGMPSVGKSNATNSIAAPVQMDEDTEIAVLAEVEREIYAGMESLENLFEALHCKAEVVRRALRERAAGLAMAAQVRRGSGADGVEVRLGTPCSGVGNMGNGCYLESEVDDGWAAGDDRSELAPDDSASNISMNRRKRRSRRTPAPIRTPILVEEEDEE